MDVYCPASIRQFLASEEEINHFVEFVDSRPYLQTFFEGCHFLRQVPMNRMNPQFNQEYEHLSRISEHVMSTAFSTFQLTRGLQNLPKIPLKLAMKHGWVYQPSSATHSLLDNAPSSRVWVKVFGPALTPGMVDEGQTENVGPYPGLRLDLIYLSSQLQQQIEADASIFNQMIANLRARLEVSNLKRPAEEAVQNPDPKRLKI